jgi:hypothetical protein
MDNLRGLPQLVSEVLGSFATNVLDRILDRNFSLASI